RDALHVEPVVERDAELDDPHDEEQQRKQDERELDHRLTVLTVLAASDAFENTSTHEVSRRLSEPCSVSFNRVARSSLSPEEGIPRARSRDVCADPVEGVTGPAHTRRGRSSRPRILLRLSRVPAKRSWPRSRRGCAARSSGRTVR